MRRFRPQISLFAAYALVIASVLGSVTSASLAGTAHYQLCITSIDGGKPAPVQSGDHGLCCLIGHGAQAFALAPEIEAFVTPFHFGGVEIVVGRPEFRSFDQNGIANPRAPPVRV